MCPKDNIFDIYNIGKPLPFQIKRCGIGLARRKDETTILLITGK